MNPFCLTRVRSLIALTSMALFSLVNGAAALAQSQFNALGAKPLSAVVSTPYVRAELLAYAPDGVQVGKPLWLGLQMQHKPQWHTYWKNPGDSGLPTQLKWTLPAGLDAGDIAWPTPKKIMVGHLANLGYEGTTLLAIPLTVASTFQGAGNEIVIGLKAQWLVCKTECIPEEADFALKLPIKGSTASHRSLFEGARNALPKPHAGATSLTVQDKLLRMTVSDLPAAFQGKQLEAFPESAEITETAAKPVQSWRSGVWHAELPLNTARTSDPRHNPANLAWVLTIAGNSINPALRINTRLQGAWPAAAAQAQPSQALEAALLANSANNGNVPAIAPATLATWMSASFWLAVIGAFLGGLILNLMPCVLPVLAIKLLGFAPKKVIDGKSSIAVVKIESTGGASVHSDDTLSFRSASGLFAVGVILSFVLLGAALLGLRAAGQSLGWGFQLQSPGMVLGLAVLFLLIGLNLFDAFELRMLLPARLANFQAEHPSVEAVASGALAVLVASPCTAPFMGASLGLAVVLPMAQALLIFVALGLGMALPFMLLAVWPSLGGWLLKILPKPGLWMLVLRDLLAWPMFATVLWLLWIYAQQTSLDLAFSVMVTLVILAALLWAMRLTKGKLKNSLVTLLALTLAGSVWLWWMTPAQSAALGSMASAASSASSAASTAAGPTAATATADASMWLPWSAKVQAEARASGRPVLIDFTAAWCITCQVNKKSTLERREVLTALKAKNVLLLRADWTRKDDAISAELARLGRTGLPVYALYAPKAAQPTLLPEVLSSGVLLSSLSGF